MKVNVEGLTFGAWLALVEKENGAQPKTLVEEREERQAWLNGVRPLDWAFLTQRKEVGQ